MLAPANLGKPTDNFYQRADRLRLGATVLPAGERVCHIRPNNTLGDWLSLEEAVARGIAYAGPVDAEVLALDADTTVKPKAMAGLATINTILLGEGFTPVLVRSGRPTHAHLFTRVPDPDVHQEVRSLSREFGVDVRSFIRPPLSPHRLGLPVALEPPMTVAMAEHVLRRRDRRPLSDRMQRILITGVSEHLSDSERLMGLCNAMFMCGWTCRQAYSELWQAPGGRTLERVVREERDPWAYMLATWRSSRDWVLAHPPLGGFGDTVEQLVMMREAVLSHSFPGRNSGTQRAVMLALVDLGIKISSVTVNASERQLTELSGRATRRATSNALQDLRADGWLAIEALPTATEATCYRLLPHRVNKTPPTTLLSGGGVRLGGVFLTHDTFARGGGLGMSAAWAYEALSTMPRSSREIAETARLSSQAAGRALRRLRRSGLAVEDDRLWTRGTVHVDEVARRRGSQGSGKDLASKHAAERDAFRGYAKTETGSLVFTVTAQRTEPVVCRALTIAGRRCRAHAVLGEGLCAAHIRDRSTPCLDDQFVADEYEQQLLQEYQSAWDD